MNTTKKQFIIYMVCVFVISWTIQLIASAFENKGDVATFKLILVGVMFVPFLSVLIARIPLKGMGWIPHLKGKVKFVFLALWLPAVLSTLGGLLFFAIFPNTFDAEFETLKTAMGEAALATLESHGITLPMYIAITAVQAVTFAPFLNMFIALGEEVGWRGAMYPYLKEKLGVTKGRFLGGAIWGAWHWPIIILAGYEYGKNYFGAPVLGMVLFCAFCIALGILQDYLYDRTKCIWISSLLHGSTNAFTIAAFLLKPDFQNYMILGPLYIGIISMIPLVITAILVSVRESRQVDTAQ